MTAERSLVIQSGVRLASPLAVVVAVALFFAGHNQPGGGFAAGLVLGAIASLRSAAGLSIPQHPTRLMSAGGAIVGLVAIAPLLVGDVVLDQYVWSATVPVLGKVKAGTALIFDIGVVLVVGGLIVAMLESLASSRPDDQAPAGPTDRATSTSRAHR